MPWKLYSISINSIRISPGLSHQKSHNITPWLKNDNKITANPNVHGFFQTSRARRESTTTRLTAVCSTNGCARTPKNPILLINLYFS